MAWGSWLGKRQKLVKATLPISTALLIVLSGMWGTWAWVA
jgi:hypothetical protein